MVLIEKTEQGEVYDTYKIVSGGRGSYLSQGFLVPHDADINTIITTLLLATKLPTKFCVA